MHQRQDKQADISLSKRLSWLLRHGAPKEGFQFSDGGYLFVDELLRHRSFQSCALADVQRVVANNSKQRFELREDGGSGRLQIRASQGHSVSVQELRLAPISLEEADAYGSVVHGTYRRHWPSIRSEGLRPMRRTHVHFAPEWPQGGATGGGGGGAAPTGMRQSADVHICLDLRAAIADGIPFGVSNNGVILSEGNEDGCIPPKYFKAVWQKRPMRLIFKDGEPFE